MEYGRYKISYYIEIINIFLKNVLREDAKKTACPKNMPCVVTREEPYQLRSAVSRNTAEMTSALPAHP